MNSLQFNGLRSESDRSPSAYTDTRYDTLRISTTRQEVSWNLKCQSLADVTREAATLDDCERSHA